MDCLILNSTKYVLYCIVTFIIVMNVSPALMNPKVPTIFINRVDWWRLVPKQYILYFGFEFI